MIDILGYIASILAVISFLMKDVVKLRTINLIACMMFIVYGILTNTAPVVAVNSIVALIQIYYIFKKK
jgi:uncharacterized protein with PQ loop repeat